MSEFHIPASDLAINGTALSCENQQRLGQYVGKIGSNELVFDRPDSHLSVHSSVQPYLEASLSKINLANPIAQSTPFEVDHGEPVGKSECVEVEADDEVVWAQRQNRKNYTRFVTGREAEDCSKVSVVLSPTSFGNKILSLTTAYVGPNAPIELGEAIYKENAVQLTQSCEFWLGNSKTPHGRALIYDQSIIEPDSFVLPFNPYQ